MEVPKFHEMMNPLLQALYELGGSGNIDEINNKVVKIMELPNELTEIPHAEGPRTEIDYRLAWTRTYLKNYGLITNSSRGVWTLLKTKDEPYVIDPMEVIRIVREKQLKKREELDVDIEDEEIQNWKDELKEVLLNITPSQFERLTQRMLREAGFIQVEVTGKSGDGGIDGKGIIRLGGILSFHVMFQCKRYKDMVSVGHIRDFRGALQGRADKGLFITTGTFTRDAVEEAKRDGATPIDLIDGEELADKLKELSLGIGVKMVEEVIIDHEWFNSI